jgi:protein-S-isoprenylcysteine O-methyltransferase Ste14
MPLLDEMEANGLWLFRWRGLLPVAMFALFFAGLSHRADPADNHGWQLACLGVSCLGLLVRAATVGFTPPGTSGRNRAKQVAESLNTTGMYSIVRNPLYLANFLVGLGVAMLLGAWWLPVIYALLFLLYYERIIFAEERFLTRKFGDVYVAWASRTPMLLPRLRGWQAPALPLNRRKILRVEHQTIFGVVVVFYLCQALGHWQREEPPFADGLWNAIGVVSLTLFLLARFFHRCTNLWKDPEPAPAGDGP